ncbi:MAG TPA: 30S ribosomal protein S12 methylthiotransferase RimO [Bacillota bacterium]|nr:30S ribosomal protein S12 methylthiotransferase RimO [Bacillota bacterium]HOL50586.1 30S ribosomal protein S12 methylthiotransferase RimO [Bacillota bacterium]
MSKVGDLGTKIAFCSLGCSKNLVDTEIMMGLLRDAGMEIVSDEHLADVILVNTCSFIADAAQESVDAILDYADLRADGKLQALLVTGCLPQRYGVELMREIPEIDGIIGTGQFGRCVEAVEDAVAGRRPAFLDDPGYLQPADAPRVVTTPAHYAYLKIGEGCANRCAYCIIPSIRGGVQSRPLEAVVGEAEKLVADGMREAIVIAQDTTVYGVDLYGVPSLAKLLRKLARVEGLEWIRVMYAYPSRIDDELVEVMASTPNIVKYIDLPMQHGSDRLLRAMNRHASRDQMIEVVARLREQVPGIVIRTSLIVGFPGETDRDFEELLDFIKIIRPERAGVFKFSREEGTRAYDMPEQVPDDVAEARRDAAMEALRRISREYGLSRVGSKVRVIVDGPSDESDLVVEARSFAEAPDVDGKIYIGDATLRPGQLVDVIIEDASDYDLAAVLV